MATAENAIATFKDVRSLIYYPNTTPSNINAEDLRCPNYYDLTAKSYINVSSSLANNRLVKYSNISFKGSTINYKINNRAYTTIKRFGIYYSTTKSIWETSSLSSSGSISIDKQKMSQIPKSGQIYIFLELGSVPTNTTLYITYSDHTTTSEVSLGTISTSFGSSNNSICSIPNISSDETNIRKWICERNGKTININIYSY